MEQIDINSLSEEEKRNWENTIKKIIVSSREFQVYNSARQTYKRHYDKMVLQAKRVNKAIVDLQKVQKLNEKHWDKLIPGWRLFFAENPDELEQAMEENKTEE